MRKAICVIAIPAVCTLFPLWAGEDPSNTDRETLQGTWEIQDSVPKRSLEVKGDTFIFRADGKITRQVKATLQATTNPKALDLKEDGEDKPFLAIYKLDKDRLTLCIAVDKARPTSARPNAFEAKPDQTLATYTRAKN
jgi:uncharacterized protein (TIGR03067 family)